MNKIRTLIIDDEPDSKIVLEIMLKETCANVEIVGTCASANEAIEEIQRLKPDLILLDIEMPRKDGFEVIKSFENPTFKVIIISGYEQYALKAIKLAAIDYVLKPFDISELESAIHKVEAALDLSDQRVKHLKSYLESSEKAQNKLIIPTLKGFHTIEFDNIVSIEAQAGNYALFQFMDQSHDLVTKPLSYFEEMLPAEQFFRIHRSYVVNLNKVSAYDSKKGIVLLQNGQELEVAVRRRGGFQRSIKGM